jgi:hypothetical protein
LSINAEIPAFAAAANALELALTHGADLAALARHTAAAAVRRVALGVNTEAAAFAATAHALKLTLTG